MSIKNPSTSDFIRLLTEHQLAIKGLILSMAPGCQDADDILQDVNVMLWERRESFREGSDYKAWAYAIARIKVMQYWDKQRRLGKICLSNEFLESVAEARKDDSSDSLTDKLEILSECMRGLKLKERELLHARYSGVTTLETYAERVGSTVGSIKVTLHRIKIKLKSCVEKNVRLRIHRQENFR